MEPVLQVDNLSKRYDGFAAVDGISFSVNAGEIVGLLGPNGAGKSTTINMLLGLVDASDGDIRVFGKDIKTDRSAIASRMNFATTSTFLPGNLTIWENLYVFGLLYGDTSPSRRIDTLLRLVRLENFRDKKTGFLSSGEQTRLNIAKTLVNDPELLLLDEPTASLDPENSREIRGLIRARTREQGTAVLWTSHNMHEVEEVCDRVLFLSRGKILLAGDPRTLPGEHQKKNLEELFISIAKESLNHHA